MQKSVFTKLSFIQAVRIVCQIIFFILLPDLFITVFSTVGEVLSSLIAGTFVFSEMRSGILLIFLIMMLTLIWGRFFCGFMCSFGAMQDLLYAAGRHIPARPELTRGTDRILKIFKYIVLLAVVFGVWIFRLQGDALWSPWTIFGMYAAPWKGLPSASVLLSMGGVLFIIIVIGSLLVERFFCRYLCPLGAIFSLISRFRIFRLKRDPSSCTGAKCRVCTGVCSMSIPLYRTEEVASGECIDCMKCVSACPRKNIKTGAIPALCIILTAATVFGAVFIGAVHVKTDYEAEAALGNEALSAETMELMPRLLEGVLLPVNETCEPRGIYPDGIHTGSGSGYRGTTNVSVTVENGWITGINIDSYRDDNKQFSKAQNSVIPAIISSQSVDVDSVSGATYSSRSIINAVRDALGL